jgi:hypothetical protein
MFPQDMSKIPDTKAQQTNGEIQSSLSVRAQTNKIKQDKHFVI